ncbi:MAG: ABC transporter permease [Verrucomicrobia bacterium]|nr:ABC transporter permease [Verrucomicrobiota bacterium]
MINLALPIIITAVIGLTFGKSDSGKGMGKIQIAVVDEDENVLGGMLSGIFNQGEGKEYFSPVTMSRSEALQRLQRNKLSAVYLIPDGFSEAYLKGEGVPPLELIKNPAQRYHPAIVEEYLGIIVEGLNVVARNLKDELPEIFAVVEEDKMPDMISLGAIIVRLGQKFEKAEDYLVPPLVTFEESTSTSISTTVSNKEKKDGGFNLFALLLPMLSSVFLLYLADHSVRDIYKELNKKTLTRIKAVHSRLFPVVVSKSILAMIACVFGGLILFIGGGMIFQIRWQNPIQIFILLLSYSLCASGFLTMLVGFFKTEKRAENFSSLVILAIAFLGGGFFTTDSMPQFVQDNISPWMPNYWFIQSVRAIEFGRGDADWILEVIKMIILGGVFLVFGAYKMHRNLEKGGEV